MNRFKKDRRGASSIGYMMLFMFLLVLVILTFFMTYVAKLMSAQHDIDDALTDSVLASLVADPNDYFNSLYSLSSESIKLQSPEHSFDLYQQCMTDAMSNEPDFYQDFAFDTYITYEVSGGQVVITRFDGQSGSKSVSTGTVGNVQTPNGKKVTSTSAYAKVTFDLTINSQWDVLTRSKAKECYCSIKEK